MHAHLTINATLCENEKKKMTKWTFQSRDIIDEICKETPKFGHSRTDIRAKART